MNLTKAAKVIEYARSVGVTDFCICAGARNSPFIVLLDENKSIIEADGKIWNFFEERSASFFALGLSQQQKKPVAIITTSGTAATELLSATVEAFYTKTPLLLITADRPPQYRGTGAPQAIEQLNIFSHYTPPTFDLTDHLECLGDLRWNQEGPLHLNVCFSEPLLNGDIPKLSLSFGARDWLATKAMDAKLPPDEVKTFLDICKKPLFIVSGLTEPSRNFVAPLLRELSGPSWIESLSGLRGDPHLENQRVKSGERLLQYWLSQDRFDGVIRIGSVPTTRVWRDLEEKYPLPVLSLSESSWSGLSRPSVVAPIFQLETVANHYRAHVSFNKEQKLFDHELHIKLLAVLKEFPNSELSLVRHLSQIVGHSPLYLGNSLPIREWDWVAAPHRPHSINGNRGANGIDGQLSTFLGWRPQHTRSWALLGDLTTLYDLSAPWICSQQENTLFTLVIMNNSGGQIFRPMFGRDAFLNRHELRFDKWAEMWGLQYLGLESLSPLPTKLPHVLELRPSETQSQQLRTRIDSLWKENLL